MFNFVVLLTWLKTNYPQLQQLAELLVALYRSIPVGVSASMPGNLSPQSSDEDLENFLVSTLPDDETVGALSVEESALRRKNRVDGLAAPFGGRVKLLQLLRVALQMWQQGSAGNIGTLLELLMQFLTPTTPVTSSAAPTTDNGGCAPCSQ